ncbi:hypothetical protein K490DRAFT_55179 [Saccharata proteae CBS 121410]|uniref:Uncharacterized protein n=1 Tax=Saccharata proteae CBS 121410 TaxID=1314787 RepID=A0A6A5YD00_9PEZI|nr:hypothetical protein K490DRAFT_55179 [Saccharata proteae CBS 121410]
MSYKLHSYEDFMHRGFRELNQDELEAILPDAEDQQEPEIPMLIMHCRCRHAVIGHHCLNQWVSERYPDIATCLWCGDDLWRVSLEDGPFSLYHMIPDGRVDDDVRISVDHRPFDIAHDNDALDLDIMNEIQHEFVAGVGAFAAEYDYNVVIRRRQMMWAIKKYMLGDLREPDWTIEWAERSAAQGADRSTLNQCTANVYRDLESWFEDNEGTWWKPPLLQNRLNNMIKHALLPRHWPRVQTAGADFDVICERFQEAVTNTIKWRHWAVWNRENRVATGAIPPSLIANRVRIDTEASRARAAAIYLFWETLTPDEVDESLAIIGLDAAAIPDLSREFEQLQIDYHRRIENGQT